MTERLLTVEDLAELLAVPKSFIYSLNHRKEGPPIIRLGTQQIRYEKDQVLRWISERTETDKPGENS